MKNTFTYKIGDSLYINLTNRCTNDCVFCVRREHNGVEGYDLRLTREPTAEEVIGEMGFPKKYKEIVFCGFGEPSLRIDELKAIARYVKKCGGRTRLNTNGHGSFFHGRDIEDELAGLIDTVSISLNASTAEKYTEVCRSGYGAAAFYAMLEFAKKCVEKRIHTVLSVVDTLDKEEIAECAQIAKNLGAEFRVREMIK